MLVGFARYSQDRSFSVLGRNRTFVLVMAAGSVVGSYIGGLLLGRRAGRGSGADPGGDPGHLGREALAAQMTGAFGIPSHL